MKLGRFTQFYFPVVMTGEDPEREGYDKSRMSYISLNFKKPADKRAVKRAIKKYFKTAWNKTITTEQAENMFKVGFDYMHKVRELAQEDIDNITPERIEEVIAGATARANEALEKEKAVI